jgi:peptidylprolyl isomerase
MSTQTESAKRRGQAFAGGFAGLAIVVVLAVVFFVVKNSDDSDKTPAAASRPAASQPADAGQPTEAGQPSAPAPADPGQPSAPAVNIPPALSKEPDVKPGKGKLTKLVATVLVPGTGPAVQKGQTVIANYKLINYLTGETLDSSWSRKEPITTQVGVGAVIQGWDQGIPGQKVGSRVQLDVPEALAYPGKGDLRFVVDILAAQ